MNYKIKFKSICSILPLKHNVNKKSKMQIIATVNESSFTIRWDTVFQKAAEFMGLTSRSHCFLFLELAYSATH